LDPAFHRSPRPSVVTGSDCQADRCGTRKRRTYPASLAGRVPLRRSVPNLKPPRLHPAIAMAGVLQQSRKIEEDAATESPERIPPPKLYNLNDAGFDDLPSVETNPTTRAINPNILFRCTRHGVSKNRRQLTLPIPGLQVRDWPSAIQALPAACDFRQASMKTMPRTPSSTFGTRLSALTPDRTSAASA
jgi:hypothetical protein